MSEGYFVDIGLLAATETGHPGGMVPPVAATGRAALVDPPARAVSAGEPLTR